MTEKPRYAHDCDNCVFLGWIGNTDLYVCARKGVIDTVIARYSSEGSDYASGLIFGVRFEEMLPEGNASQMSFRLYDAMKRALKLGYKLPRPEYY